MARTDAAKVLLLRGLQVVIDLGVFWVAYGLAFAVRFDWEPPDAMLARFALTLPHVLVLKYAVLVVFGVHRFSWKDFALRETVRVLAALGTASAVLLAARLLLGALSPHIAAAEAMLIPIGVIAIDFVLAFLGTAGVRVIRRLSVERSSQRAHRRARREEVPTIIIGAGPVGLLVAREIEARPDLGIVALGFVDDDPLRRGTLVHGLPVLGTTRDLARVASVNAARQALIAIPNAPGETVRHLLAQCEAASIRTKIIPGLFEVVGGSVNLSRLRDIAIDDLLRRAPVVLDSPTLDPLLHGKVVLVTGAGGSIGSELCRHVSRFEVTRLILVDRYENGLFEIHRELGRVAPELEIHPAVLDVQDADAVRRLLEAQRPDVILHAAAHKHVPLMEQNAAEAVKNNVIGTRVFADLAAEHDVGVFVLISTDKAVNPASIMGATKRIAERYVQLVAARSATRFLAVRFGNVLGSSGSVIRTFRDQIERGGPVTVTHPAMQRYFMTVSEACSLVLEAAALGKGGEIFMLDMGEPVRIVDLARDLIRLSGLAPDEIEIVFSGVRSGEKLREDLAFDDEGMTRTRHPKIFVGHPRIETGELLPELDRLAALAEGGDTPELTRALEVLVPGYRRDATARDGRAPRENAESAVANTGGTIAPADQDAGSESLGLERTFDRIGEPVFDGLTLAPRSAQRL